MDEYTSTITGMHIGKGVGISINTDMNINMDVGIDINICEVCTEKSRHG